MEGLEYPPNNAVKNFEAGLSKGAPAILLLRVPTYGYTYCYKCNLFEEKDAQ